MNRTPSATLAVRLRLMADLRKYLPRGSAPVIEVQLRQGATVADALAAAGVRSDEQVTASRNGELAQLDAPVDDGDELVCFSPMEGG